MATSSEGGSGQAKRISFLVPYIDFSFMLIVIFVGMLAIATFEPLGSTQVETKKDVSPEGLAGDYENARKGKPGTFAPIAPGDAEGAGTPKPEDITPLLEKKGAAPGLSEKERRELEKLREDVRRLEGEIAAQGAPAEGGPENAKTGERKEPGLKKSGGAAADKPGPQAGGDPGRYDMVNPEEKGELPGGKKEAEPEKPGGAKAGETLPGETREGPGKGPNGEPGGPESADEGGKASGKHYFLDLRK